MGDVPSRWRVAAAARAVAAFAVILAVGFALGGLRPETAFAEPALSYDGLCDPSDVRPFEAALITCTFNVTNTGDETAAGLQVFIGDPAECGFTFVRNIDRTINGEATPDLGDRFELGNLAPAESIEVATRFLVENFGTGPRGNAVTIFPLARFDLRVGGDLCWNVSADAAAPPTNLVITKTPLAEQPCIIIIGPTPAGAPEAGSTDRVALKYPLRDVTAADRLEPSSAGGLDGGGAPQGFFCGEPPPRPDYGGPLPIEAPVIPPDVQYEIVISNVSDTAMTDVRLLDVETGQAMFVEADPPASGEDALGRPTWELGALGPGEEVSVLATYGPPLPDSCVFARDVALVTATLEGGGSEDYAAESSFGLNIGACDFGFDNNCWHYPPAGYPASAPCDVEVCWAPVVGSEDQFRRLYEGCEQELCWAVPPGDGSPRLGSCSEEVCWLSFFFGFPEEDFLFAVDCDGEFCAFSDPGGTLGSRGYCTDTNCWASPPEGDRWQRLFDCGESHDWCWFSPPEGASLLGECDFPINFAANPPEGSVDFGLGPFVVYFDDPACWPVPPEAGAFFTQPVRCEALEFYCWLTAPDGQFTFIVWCDDDYCWEPFPDGVFPPDIELPPLFPFFCSGEEGAKTPEPGVESVPVEVVEGESAAVVIVEGTSEPLEPLPSAEVVVAEIVRPDIQDWDGDGCTNLQERGANVLRGGERDPASFWDFFDTPNASNARDSIVSAPDIARVVARFGSSGDKDVDPLSAPAPAPAYHTAFDRTPAGDAPNGRAQGPNGGVSAQDIALIVGEFGHTCA